MVVRKSAYPDSYRDGSPKEMDAKDWYVIDDIDKLDTPALVIYPDRVNQNITLAKEMIGDVSRLRPHVKTHKCVQTTMQMLEAGITKFKCATIAEAEMLGLCKAPDVLLAYQPVGPKLERFIKLIKTYPDIQISCLVDNVAAAKYISEEAVKQKLEVTICIDLNVGQNRTGIDPKHALNLYWECLSMPGIKIAGLHAYDGHIHDADLHIRTQKCNAAFEHVVKLVNEIKQRGWPDPVIIAGGSPTFPIHVKREGIECSPGTFVYWDRGYSLNCAEQAFRPAAIVVSR